MPFQLIIIIFPEIHHARSMNINNLKLCMLITRYSIKAEAPRNDAIGSSVTLQNVAIRLLHGVEITCFKECFLSDCMIPR